MFNCTQCAKHTGPRVPPFIVALVERPKTYTNMDYSGEEPEVKTTMGMEIEREGMLCPMCATGKVAPVERKVDLTPHLVLGATVQAHARKCNKMLSECEVCKRNIRSFASIPTPALTPLMSEPQAHNGRLSMCGLILDKVMTTTPNKNKRGVADIIAGATLLKDYEEHGGKL